MKTGPLQFFFKRARALTDSGAWLLIVFGLLMFAARIPLSPGGFINLPVVVTVLQTAGLMFTLAGLQVMISMIVWPSLNFGRLAQQVCDEGSTSAALAIFGLLVYNGLSLIGFVLWLSSAMGANLAGGS